MGSKDLTPQKTRAKRITIDVPRHWLRKYSRPKPLTATPFEMAIERQCQKQERANGNI